ncbi:MAG: hypothetical protein WC860_08920 [Candidatus Margulisiibacteriota bacterium]|jgi:hypothetical protein
MALTCTCGSTNIKTSFDITNYTVDHICRDCGEYVGETYSPLEDESPKIAELFETE